MASSGKLPRLPEFPLLGDDNHAITSPATPEYNCIAWAAGDTSAFWWPDPAHTAYWPEGISREETLEVFPQAYATLGYAVCEDGGLEVGFEKIAIYVLDGTPTHAARQLADGAWTSKLGKHVDIKHAADALDGPCCGKVALFMKRPRTT